MRNVSSVLKTALIAGAFAASTLAVSTPVQAGKYSNFTDAMQHFTECANWLLSDPAKHAQFCAPGHDVFVSGSTGFAAPEERCEQIGTLTTETIISCEGDCCPA